MAYNRFIHVKAKMTLALEFLVDLYSIHQCCFFPYFPYESCVVLSLFMTRFVLAILLNFDTEHTNWNIAVFF